MEIFFGLLTLGWFMALLVAWVWGASQYNRMMKEK
jgi:hypothetical protein